MSTDKQLADKINRWLEAEAPMQLPDRVLRATFERTRTARQQGGWRALLGRMHMNRFVPLGVGAAAVAVVFLGAQLVMSPGDVGPAAAAPTPTPEPSVAPSVSPSIVPSSTSPAGMPQGTYELENDPVPMTVTIPAPGWSGDPGSAVLVKNETVDPPEGTGLIVFSGMDGVFVYGDPCRWSTTTPETPARTVDEVVSALSEQASRDASEPEDITLGGYAGKVITLHVPDDAVFADCDQGYFGSWRIKPEATPARYHQGPGQIDRLWIVDVDGELVIIDGCYYEASPQADVDELEAIINSIQFK